MTQAFERRHDIEMQQVQVDRLNASAILIDSHRLRIAAQVASVATQMIEARVANYNNSYGQVIDKKNFRGIAGRIAHETIYRLVSCGIPLSGLPKNMDEADVLMSIELCAEDAFDCWWRTKNDFLPSSQYPGRVKFRKEYPSIDSLLEEHQGSNQFGEVRTPTPTEHQLFEDVRSCIEHLELLFDIQSGERAIFEEVRGAAYEPISKVNIQELLPSIRDAYNQAWLGPDLLENLRSNDPRQIKKFMEETEKGKFVFGFDEHPDGKPSVAEQMIADFSKEYAADEPRYEGRYLKGDNDKILAWLTFWRKPRNALSHQYRQMIEDYLDHGVTGGTMMYTRKPSRVEFQPHLDRIFMIDTIQGLKPSAAARLIAKTVQEIREDRSFKMLMGYRIHELMIDPEFPSFREPYRFNENGKSGKFFLERGCRTFAFDHNPQGLASTREFSDGSSVKIRPEWAAFSGPLEEMEARSWQLWGRTQRKYGDISSDGYSPKKLHRDYFEWMDDEGGGCAGGASGTH